MKWMPRAFLSVWSVLPVAMVPLAALAAEDDVVVDEKVVIDENNVPGNQHADGENNGFNDEKFERAIFARGGDAKQFLTNSDAELERTINDLDRQVRLTDAQKRNLAFTAQSVQKRFFNRVDVLKQKWRVANEADLMADELFAEFQSLQTQARTGLFGAESFFVKAVRTKLNVEQRAKLAAADLERRHFHRRALVGTTLLAVSRSVVLRSSQRHALTKLLLEETPVPTGRLDTDSKLMMYQFAGLAEARVKPLLDDDQWQDLQSQLTEFRSFEALLRREGLITPDNMKDDVSQADDAPAGAAQAAQFRKKTE